MQMSALDYKCVCTDTHTGHPKSNRFL